MKKTLLALLATFLMVGMFAGCSDSDSSDPAPSATPEPTMTPEPTATTTPEPTDAPSEVTPENVLPF